MFVLMYTFNKKKFFLFLRGFQSLMSLEQETSFYEGQDLDLLLRTAEFSEKPVGDWIWWISKTWFAWNDRKPASLRRALMKRFLFRSNWKSYFDLLPYKETILTYLCFCYPNLVETSLELGEEFGIDINGCGDGFYAAAWFINVQTSTDLQNRNIQSTILQCIDRTDDILLKTSRFHDGPRKHQTIIGRLQEYMHSNKQWRLIWNHLLLRSYDDRSGIDMLSELPLGTCDANVELQLIETRQRQYQLFLPGTLREAIDKHAISCIGGLLTMIMSFSWTYSPITKYTMVGTRTIRPTTEAD